MGGFGFGSVILGVLILSLLVPQIQVEAKSCCPTTAAQDCYTSCDMGLQLYCEERCGCTIIPPHGGPCPTPRNSEAAGCCQMAVFPPTGVICKDLSPEVCKITFGCRPAVGPFGNICPFGENSGEATIEYCKLGCASSVCDAISTLQISGEEVVNEAVGQCKNACSAFCTKGSTLEIA